MHLGPSFAAAFHQGASDGDRCRLAIAWGLANNPPGLADLLQERCVGIGIELAKAVEPVIARLHTPQDAETTRPELVQIVNEDEPFIDRKAVRDRLCQLPDHKIRPSVVIMGDPGSGRTSVWRFAADLGRASSDVVVVQFAAGDLPTVTDLLEEFAGQIPGSVTDGVRDLLTLAGKAKERALVGQLVAWAKASGKTCWLVIDRFEDGSTEIQELIVAVAKLTNEGSERGKSLKLCVTAGSVDAKRFVKGTVAEIPIEAAAMQRTDIEAFVAWVAETRKIALVPEARDQAVASIWSDPPAAAASAAERAAWLDGIGKRGAKHARRLVK